MQTRLGDRARSVDSLAPRDRTYSVPREVAAAAATALRRADELRESRELAETELAELSSALATAEKLAVAGRVTASDAASIAAAASARAAERSAGDGDDSSPGEWVFGSSWTPPGADDPAWYAPGPLREQTPRELLGGELLGGDAGAEWAERITASVHREAVAARDKWLDGLEWDPDEWLYAALADADDPDLLRGLVRAPAGSADLADADAYVAGGWRPLLAHAAGGRLSTMVSVPVGPNLLAMCASALSSGARGVLLRHGRPLAQLPERPLLAAGTKTSVGGIQYVYAVVDPTDTSSVLSLVMLKPGPVAYTRQGGQWVLDPTTLQSLLSMTPPPLVELTGSTQASVVREVDEAQAESAAQGGTDGTTAPAPGAAAVATAPSASGPSGAAPGAAGQSAGAAAYAAAAQAGSDDSSDGSGDESDTSAPLAAPPSQSDLDDNAESSGTEADTSDEADAATQVGQSAQGARPRGGASNSSARKKQPGQKPDTASTGRASPNGTMPPRERGLTAAASLDLLGELRRGYSSALAAAARSQRREEERVRDWYASDDGYWDCDPDYAGACAELLGQQVSASARQHAMSAAAELRSALQLRALGLERILLPMVAVAGREVTPEDVRDTDRLKDYWMHGAGAVKVAWGSPGDFDRCVAEVGKYMPPDESKGYCATLHHRVLGIWPATHAKMVREADGQEAAEKASHGHGERRS